MRRAALLLAGGLLCLQPAAFPANAPQAGAAEIPLYPADVTAPAVAAHGDETVRITEQGEHVVTNVHRPSVTVYLPTKARATGTAVVVIPGGGYRELWMDHEGVNVARFLNEQGIAAFVLKYRLPRAPESQSQYVMDDPLADLMRAVRLVRSRAAEWSVDAQRIGVLGFSAGGNLAGRGVMNSDSGNATATAPVDRASSRPDFAALIYPGTSAEIQLKAGDPPLFLLCGGDDRPDVVAGVTRLYQSAHDLKIPAEVHVYDRVGHGFGLRSTNTGPVAAWPRQFVDWLAVEKFVPSK